MSLVVPEAHQQFQVTCSDSENSVRPLSHYAAHPSSSQYQCGRKAENHVCLDGNQGRWSSIFKFGVQEGRYRSQQAVRHHCFFSPLRFTNLVFSSAGELNSDELERLVTIIQNPTQFKIPTWFLNRQKDIVDGKNSQILSNNVDSKLREDLERLKKIRAHRGLRHFWGLRVRGQHTKTTGTSSLLPSY